MAIVATTKEGNEELIIAVARSALIEPKANGEAEAAIVVEDRCQRRGLGTILLKRLVEYGRDHGIKTFLGLIHPSNSQIARLIKRSGLPSRCSVSYGVREIRVELTGEATC